jgi:hypothetical protein
LAIAFTFIGLYSYSFQKQHKDQLNLEQTAANKWQLKSQIETFILLGVVDILFFLFLIIQSKHLFLGLPNATVNAIDYVEYARSGFFELIAVAVISFVLLLITERITPKVTVKHSLTFKVLSVVLILEVVAIMFSAFKRLYLYEQAFGFTTLRLYSHAFIILLAVIFFLFMYKIIKDTEENKFVFNSFIATMLFLVGMNLLNPDRFIARNNLLRYTKSMELDLGYLKSLSTDAIPEIIGKLNILDSSQQNIVKEDLVNHFLNEKSDEYHSSWPALNLSRLQTDKEISKIRVAK